MIVILNVNIAIIYFFSTLMITFQWWHDNIWEYMRNFFWNQKNICIKAYFWIWQVTLRGLFSNFDAAVRTWWRIYFIFLAGIAVSDSYHRKIVCILSVWEQQVTIISQSHAWGVYRLLKDGVWWRWRMAIEPNLMFLNIIMSAVMVLMLETYQRQFIWIYIFSKGANMSNIWCHYVFREYWFRRVCGLCKHFCIGCKAMFTWHCKVCLMHELMKCEIWWVSKFCCLSFFFFTLLQWFQRHSEIRKTPGKSCWHMGFCDWDDCNKTGKVSFSISAVTSGGLVWV